MNNSEFEQTYGMTIDEAEDLLNKTKERNRVEFQEILDKHLKQKTRKQMIEHFQIASRFSN